jgi:GntR family transcriptional regulator
MEPRYAELTRSLISSIAAGTYAVGTNLPSENELAEAFEVSRGTVRMALDRLLGLGLISRRKRAGTRVEARHPPVAQYQHTISSVEELIQYTADTKRVIQRLRFIVADLKLSALTGCAPGSEWMEVQATREVGAGGYPIASWSVYVAKSDAELIRTRLKNDQRLICDLIHEATGRIVSEVRQTVRAIGVPEDMAAVLGVPVDAHALQFVRQYVDQANELFQVSVSVHPADRSAYSTVLRRQVANDA